MTRIFPLLLATLLLCALAVLPAAATWTVGCDGNFTTIGTAVANTTVAAGDTLLIRPGTYVETVTVNKRLTLRGDAGATVNGSIKITAAGTTVEGLTVKRAGSTAIEIYGADTVVRGCTVSSGYDGISIESATNCTVEGCTLGGTIPGSGIYLSSAGGSQILDNQVTGCGSPGIMFYGDCPDCIISGNSVQDCSGAGIQLQSGCQGSVVVANTVSNNSGGFMIYGCTGTTTVLRDNVVQKDRFIAVQLESLDSVIVENVTVRDGKFGFILFDVENITLTNSTVTGTGDPGLCARSAVTNSLIANNLFNNTQNLDIRSGTDMTDTRWNTTKTFGKNIHGGPFLGGNYWLTPDGTGFSETHEDRNGDGICDEGYDLGAGCIDHLPLHTCIPTANFTAVPAGGSTPLTVQFADTSYGVPFLSRSWDFGDNSPLVDHTRPSHTFSTNGTHQVTLTVTNAFGSDTMTKTVVALDPPKAVVSANPTEGNAPLTVRFTDASTGCVFERLWTFDDNGATSTDATLPHTFENAGTYNVTLNVSNTYASNETTVKVVVHTAPKADFTFTPTAGLAPLSVTFNDTSTGDVDTWEWDFGDGTNAMGRQHVHTYRDAGNYTVTLTASNAFGSDTATASVRTFEAPAANFTVNPAGGYAPLTVSFTDTSTGDVTGWRWDFGDGSTSTEEHPSHTYASAGTYTVSLMVSNPYASNTTVQKNCIMVEAPAVSGGGGGGHSDASAGAASNIPAGGHTSFGVRNSAIYEVGVTAGERIPEILVTVERKGLPAGADAPAAAVYEYDEVTLYRTPDAALAGASLNFTVPKAWLEARGCAPEDVVLYRYHGGAWQALTTSIVSEDESCYSFVAESPGFSLFAIGVNTPAPEPTVTPAETLTAHPETTGVAETPTAPQQSPLPAGLVVLGLCAALLFLRRR
ncbi:PKD domain-containing protein [Methanofollis sp. UBA420]|uniref:PKD domain-containing protein n=1 Tax=Methanofollis sp. UBA420 TaxID=1915514 RepID=UPI00316AD6AA